VIVTTDVAVGIIGATSLSVTGLVTGTLIRVTSPVGPKTEDTGTTTPSMVNSTSDGAFAAVGVEKGAVEDCLTIGNAV